HISKPTSYFKIHLLSGVSGGQLISFNAKTSTDEQKKHDDFVDRMMEKGYTRKQVRLLCEWYLRVRKSS
ncbi:hypothetical protein, partial [Escherichia coli]|uniref:hypothetical protein n=1 Tax=Escherichia coli TaxID=562 RepID=UPI0020231F98